MTSFSLILGGTSCTLCGMEVSPSRAGGFHAPITETHSLKIRLPAPNSQSTGLLPKLAGVIRAVPSLWRGRLAARTFGALRTRLGAQALAAIFTSYEGPRAGFMNLCRRLAGSSFLPRFKFCQEPSRGIFHTFSLSPVGVPSLLAAHESNVSKDLRHERQVACKG